MTVLFPERKFEIYFIISSQFEYLIVGERTNNGRGKYFAQL